MDVDDDSIERRVFDAIEYSPEELRRLLEDGLDPNIKNELDESALMIASIRGYEDIVRLFLEYNADPNIYDDVKYTPLMRAITRRFGEIVRLLLDNGADPFIINVRGDTALDLAERYPDNAIIDLLKSRMATIRTQRAKQHLSTSRLPIADDLTEMISKRSDKTPYHPAITQRMIQEEKDSLLRKEQSKRRKKRTQKKKRKQKKEKKKKKLI